MDQVVGDPRPLLADRLRAHVVRHARGARRKDGEVGTALLLEAQLRLDALRERLVGDAEVGRGGGAPAPPPPPPPPPPEPGQPPPPRRAVTPGRALHPSP